MWEKEAFDGTCFPDASLQSDNDSNQPTLLQLDSKLFPSYTSPHPSPLLSLSLSSSFLYLTPLDHDGSLHRDPLFIILVQEQNTFYRYYHHYRLGIRRDDGQTIALRARI